MHYATVHTASSLLNRFQNITSLSILIAGFFKSFGYSHNATKAHCFIKALQRST